MDSQTSQPARRPRSGAPLPETLRTDLRGMLEKFGEANACAFVGLSRTTFGRALAGLGVTAGTVALIRAALVKQAGQP